MLKAAAVEFKIYNKIPMQNRLLLSSRKNYCLIRKVVKKPGVCLVIPEIF